MKQLLLFCVAGLLFSLPACRSTKTDYTPDTYGGKILAFGNGGGFSGKVERYLLLANGQLFTQNAMLKTDIYESLAPLDSKLTAQLFANYEQLRLNKMILRDPGNLYYFIDMKDGDAEHRLMWGGDRQTPAPNVEQYYANLYRLARRQHKLTKTTTSTTKSSDK